MYSASASVEASLNCDCEFGPPDSLKAAKERGEVEIDCSYWQSYCSILNMASRNCCQVHLFGPIVSEHLTLAKGILH